MRWTALCLGLWVLSAQPGAADTPPQLPAAEIPRLQEKFVADYLHKADAQDVDTALGSLQLAQMMDPGNAEVLRRLAVYTRKPDSFYMEILFFLPDEPNANFNLARKLAGEGFFDLAQPFFLTAAAGSTDVIGSESAARNSYFAEDYANCVRLYDRTLELGAKNATEAYLKRAECHALLGHKAEARADFGQAQALQPGTEWAYSARMFKDGVYDGCQGKAITKAGSAKKNYDAGKMYEAYRDATAALICDPQQWTAYQIRMDIEENDPNLSTHYLAHKKRFDNAVDGGKTYATRAQGQTHRTPEEMLAEGEQLDIMQNDPPMVRAAYLASRIIMVQPDNARARLLRARAYNNLNINLLAVQAWADSEIAVADPVTAPLAHRLRAILLIKVGNPQLAVDEINQTLARTPDDLRALAVRVWAYTKVGNDDAALRDIDTILARGPDAGAYQFRSEIRARRGDKAGALADIRQTVALAPDNLNARVAEIRLLDENGQKAEADERHRDLLSLKPNIRSDYLTERSPGMAQAVKAEQDVQARAEAAADQQDRIGVFLEGMVSVHARALDLFESGTEASDGYEALDYVKDAENLLADAVSDAQTFGDSTDGAAMEAEDRASFERNLDLLSEAYEIVKTQRQKLETTAYGETSEEYDPDAYDSY